MSITINNTGPLNKLRIEYQMSINRQKIIKLRNRVTGTDNILKDIEKISNRITHEQMQAEQKISELKAKILDLENSTISKEEASKMIDNIYYELPGNFVPPFKPLIENIENTIQRISKGFSLSRFGDGELEIMLGNSIACQKFHKQLAEELKQCIKADNKKVCIGLNYCYWNSLEGFRDYTKMYVRTTVAKRRKQYEEFLNPQNKYYAAECTLAYANRDEAFDFKNHYKKFKEIFSGRNIVVISGLDFRNNDLLKDAKSVTWVKAPGKNAFSKYDELMKKAQEFSPDRLVLICLGPTATVMAYNLALRDYQTLDVGHLFEDYDWYKENKINGKKEIISFFSPKI